MAKLSQKPSAVREREKQVLELLRANYTHEQIEEMVGYKPGSGAVAHIQKRIYERHIAADVDELRALHLEQLAALDQTYMVPARRGGEFGVKAAGIIHNNQKQRERYVPQLKVADKIDANIVADEDTLLAFAELAKLKEQAANGD